MSARKSPRLTEAQQRWNEVVRAEEEIRKLLDEIPYTVLRSKETARLLDNAETELTDAVAYLRKVWAREVPRYNRSAAANRVSP